MLDQVQVAITLYSSMWLHQNQRTKSKSHAQPVTGEFCTKAKFKIQIRDQSLQNSSHSTLTPPGPWQSWVTSHLFRKMWGQKLGKGGKMSILNGNPPQKWPVQNSVKISRKWKTDLWNWWYFNFRLIFHIYPRLLVIKTCCQGFSFTFRLLLNNYKASPEEHCCLSSVCSLKMGIVAAIFRRHQTNQNTLSSPEAPAKSINNDSCWVRDRICPLLLTNRLGNSQFWSLIHNRFRWWMWKGGWSGCLSLPASNTNRHF